MAKSPLIGLLWMRGSLSFLEQLCIKSFVDAGHHTVLYSYEPIGGVPDGVEHRDASEILPETGFLTHERTGSPALHSDLFRYRLLAGCENMIWADTDAYCVRPFQTDSGHFYGWESDSHINGGVLGLPRDSATLAALLEFTRDEFAIPHWYKTDYIRELEAARDAGRPVHAGEQPWGVWGPHAITHFLHETGEARHALPREALYPFSFRDRRKMVKPDVNPKKYLTDATFSVHLYGRRMRKYLAESHQGIPHPEGLLGQLLIRHKIDPLDAPLRDHPNPNRDHPHARAFRDAISGKAVPVSVRKTRSAENPAHRPQPKAPVIPLRRVVGVTTMKNEGPYILDWVAYHLSIGFTHFLVYTNDCDDGTDQILDCLSRTGLVTRVDNPADIAAGERPQRIALKLAEQHPLVTGADCYCVFDVDEYINIHIGQGHLEDLFAACGNPEMISMTWRFFGCAGVLEFDDVPVPLQFTRCAPEYTRLPHHNWGFKTLVRQPSPFRNLGIHRPLGAVGDKMPAWTNGSGQQMPDSYLKAGWRNSTECWGYALVTLNHYSIRSLDSFLVKRDRGRTNHVNRDQGIAYWNTHNRNDEDDHSILPAAERAALARRLLLLTHPGLEALHDLSVGWHRARIAYLRALPEFRDLRDRLAQDPLSHQLADDLPPADEESDEEISIPAPPAPVSAPATAPGAAPEAEARPPRKVASEPEKRPRAPALEPLLDASHPDLIRLPSGDVLATGALNERFYQAMEARADHLAPRLAPPAVPIPSDRITIVTGMRNEAPFILEWVAYHLSIGVTHFLVYTNDCDDPTDAILDRLATHGLVTRQDNPFRRDKGQKPQRIALNDALTQPALTGADWYLPIDVDEFVNIHVADGTLQGLIAEMNGPTTISMLWRFFGNTDRPAYEDRWITETFIRCAPRFMPKVARDPDNAHGLRDGTGIAPPEGRLMGWGVKTMVHRSAPFAKIGVHRPLELDESRKADLRWVNGSGRCIPPEEHGDENWRATKNSAGYRMVTLNHYALRTADSYLVKKQRGRINHVDEDQDLTYWAQRNFISETDDSILRHLPRARMVWDGLMQDAELARLHRAAADWHRARIAALKQDPDYRALYSALTAPMGALMATARESRD